MSTPVTSTPVKSRDEIFSLLQAHQQEIQGFGVKRIGVFGSFVRGEQDANSDVDILVEFEPSQKTFDHFMKLAFFLDDLFGRKAELVTTEALSPYIGPHILREVEYVAFAD